MANTIASNISASFIIEGTPIYEYGMLASTYSVGHLVYESAAGVWTEIDSSTAATLYYRMGVVGYKERILSTGAKSSIDTAYATTDTGVPILLGFVDGYGEFVMHIEDPGGDMFANLIFVVSDTGGTLEGGDAAVTTALAAGTPGTGITNVEHLASGDLYMRARWARV